MASQWSTFGSRIRWALAGAAVTALVVSSVNGAPIGLTTGGSLPVVGDKLPTGDGGAPDAIAYGTGSHWNVHNWGPGEVSAVPSSYSHNIVDDRGRTVKRMYVSSGANPDVGSAATVTNMFFSEDSGKKFLTAQQNYPVSALNMMRLNDGRLLTIDFIPAWGDAAHNFATIGVATSSDGQKWKHLTGRVEAKIGGQNLSMLRIHRRPLQLPDGTIMVPAYAAAMGSSRQHSIILQSTDLGASWTLRSVIPASISSGTNEVGWSYTSDGRLTALLRGAAATDVMQSFSEDDGVTWSEAVQLKNEDGTNMKGIFSDLVLQPNGILLATVGRPDVRVLVSKDGTARTWDIQDTVFANYPSTGNNGRFDGSSGNNSLENVAANRTIIFYDQCHTWGCGAYNEQFGISAEYLGAVTPGTGRIDVTSQLLSKRASITGEFAKRDKRFPEMRPEGAFDGSSALGAEARLQGKKQPGSLILKLDRSYPINRIGMMLGHGEPQSATVSLSADGKTWSKPVVSADQRSDRAMKYADIPVQDAQFVKVTGGQAQTVLTELELYAAGIDTFENELPFNIPRGWTEATHAWVTDVPGNDAYTEFGGYRSSTALRLWDKYTDDNARIVRPVEATDRLYGSMQWGASDLRARFTVGVRGAGADGTATDAFRFRIQQGNPAVVQAFDGTAWVNVGTMSAAVVTRQYYPMTIEATQDSATLTIGSDSFTTKVRAAATGKLSGLSFSTGDPSEYGGIYFLDDVSVSSDPGAAPSLTPVALTPKQGQPRKPLTVSTTITNPGPKPATSVFADLVAPQGWTVTPIGVPSSLAPGASAPVSFRVTPPADVAVGTYLLSLTAGYVSGGAVMTRTPAKIAVPVGVVPATALTATATSAQAGAAYEPKNAIDGNPATIWHSQWTPVRDVPPQSITLTVDGTATVSGLRYQPRTDSTTNGHITGYNVYLSTNGTDFTRASTGTWANDKTIKSAAFSATTGVRAIRLEATAAAANLVSAGEIVVLGSLD